MFKFTKPKWEVIKDKKVYETPIFSLHEKKVLPDAGENAANFYVLDAPEWINVIALTDEKEIVLVEQYRHGVDESTLEIPGGMVDAGETPIEAAGRELLEETGYESDAWEALGKASSNPAILTNFTHLFLASGCRKTGPQQTDGHEDINVHTMPLSEFLSLVENDVVHHAIVLAGVAKYLLKYHLKD